MKTAAILLAIGAGIAFASPAQAQGKDPPGVNPTHFVCYRVSQATKLKPAAVKLKDQFGAFGSKIGNPLFLCAPVSKNGEEVKELQDAPHLLLDLGQERRQEGQGDAPARLAGAHRRRLGRAVPALDQGSDEEISALTLSPFIPAQAGIQGRIREPCNRLLGPRLRGDERSKT